ncbi:MAG: ribosomal protein L7/L12 [bacterium]|nr:ribosomal protein L7/L12 [bacterium]
MVMKFLGLALVWTLCVSCIKEDGQMRQAEQNISYSVVVTSFDPDWKIRGIKAVREATGLGLADAKDLVEQNLSIVRSGLSKADAEALERTLEKSGLEIEIRAE